MKKIKVLFVLCMTVAIAMFATCLDPNFENPFDSKNLDDDSSGGDIVAPDVYGSCTVGNSCTNDVREQNCNGVFEANQTCPTKTLTIAPNPSSAATVNFLVNDSAVGRISEHPIGSPILLCLGSHSGFLFNNWSGDDITEENETNECLTFRMNDHISLTAHFTPAYDLTVNLNNQGGAITIDTTGGSNPFSPRTFPNMTNHLDGTSVRACVDSVNNNYIFTGWSGDVNSQELCVNVVMTKNIELNATFARQVTLNFSATTNTNPRDQTGGRVIILNGGDTVKNQVLFNAGTELTICANVNSTYRFEGWSGDLTGTTLCQTLVMNDDKIVTATFSRPRLRITRTLQEGGWVEVYHSNGNLLHYYGPSDSNPATSRHPLPAITVEVCAVAEDGFMFIGWTGDVTSTDACVNLQMNTDRDVTTNFRIGFNSDIMYGTLTDSRDNQTYRTVTINYGSIIRTWMAENLNYAATGSWCYGNNEANCNIYGRLYDWNTAMAGETTSNANPSGRRGVCPLGWHLPSRAEWEALTNVSGAYELKSFVGWDNWYSGGNETGFTAIPGGSRFPNGTFSGTGVNGYWWTTTQVSANDAWFQNMSSENYLVESDHTDKTHGFSVRCVRD